MKHIESKNKNLNVEKKMKLNKTLVLYVIVLTIFVSNALSVNLDSIERVKGIVIVKFKESAFEGNLDILSRESGSVIECKVLKNKELKGKFDKYGFVKAKKIFDCTPGDTIGISRTGETVKLMDLSRWFTLEFDPTFEIDSVINDFKKNPNIEKITPCRTIKQDSDPPDDEYFNLQHALEYGNTGDINILDAWDYQTGRNDVKIAVVDRGIDITHSDLMGRFLDGRDVGCGDANPYPDLTWDEQYDRSHGTKVAGIICANHNSIGIAGIMQSGKIIPIKTGNEYGRLFRAS